MSHGNNGGHGHRHHGHHGGNMLIWLFGMLPGSGTIMLLLLWWILH